MLLAQACENFPKDPDHTLERVKNGTLIVGYSQNPPWVAKTENEPIGIEVDIIKAFAKSLNAKINWKNGTKQSLFKCLKKKEINLIIAGITEDSRWKEKAAFTRPYLEYEEKKHIIAVPQGENGFLVKLEKFLHEKKQEIKTSIKL